MVDIQSAYLSHLKKQDELTQEVQKQQRDRLKSYAQKLHDLGLAASEHVRSLWERYLEETRKLNLSDEGPARTCAIASQYQDEYMRLGQEHTRAQIQEYAEWLKGALAVQMEGQTNSAKMFVSFLEQLTEGDSGAAATLQADSKTSRAAAKK